MSFDPEEDFIDADLESIRWRDVLFALFAWPVMAIFDRYQQWKPRR